MSKRSHADAGRAAERSLRIFASAAEFGMARRISAVIALALITSACLNKADAKQTDDAMTAFFAQVRAKQYDAIYAAAAPEFQAAATHDVFVGFMQRIDRKLGDCQAPVKQMDWHVNVTTNGVITTQGYVSTCANGKLAQRVTIILRNGQAQLAGYNANSPLLLTD
jgi:hypothetical protein